MSGQKFKANREKIVEFYEAKERLKAINKCKFYSQVSGLCMDKEHNKYRQKCFRTTCEFFIHEGILW
jgi:hypothetical protein